MTDSLPHYEDVEALIAAEAPEDPVYCLRPKQLAAKASEFLTLFPGDVLYAVKCNPLPLVMDRLYAAGIRHFDTASLAEIAGVKHRFPDATAYFMHPVKGWQAMREADERWGVRHYILDHESELEKMSALFGANAKDRVAVVRLGTPSKSATFNLSEKFGASTEATAALMKAAKAKGFRVGLAFHVGSQQADPAAWSKAFALAGQAIAQAGLEIDCLDVGGGFPAPYAGAEIPPLADFMSVIRAGAAALKLPAGCRLMCEPGRAMVAESFSLLLQIHLRKDETLYLNDGIYGSLLGATIGIRFPARLVRPNGRVAPERKPFKIFGPTCDSLDKLPYPVELPADAEAGDWIEVGLTGAYSAALRTGFNGFFPDRFVTLDRPFETPAHYSQAA